MSAIRATQLLAGLVLFTTTACSATPDKSTAPPQNTTAVVKQALTEFYTPGMGVGIIHQGETVYLKGVGQRNLAGNLPVTQSTYFRLASTSKAFTAAALAMAIDEFSLSWQTN